MIEQIKETKEIALLKIEFSEDWSRKLKVIIRKLQNNNEIRAIILKFDGEENFSHELRIKDLHEKNLKYFLNNMSLPIILIVQNLVSGFLFEILLASHICIASKSAKFMIPDNQLLKKYIGSRNFDKLELVENEINAETALDLGIINKICSKEDLEKEAFELAQQISELAPLAIQCCLKAVNEGLEMSLEYGLKLESGLFSQIFATEDMKEGTTAFLQKRKPVFRGK